MRQATLTLILLLFALFSKGQEYLFDLQRINPAYVGSWKSIGFTGSTKIISPHINKSPFEYAFSFQAPLESLNSGIGVNIVNQKTGLENILSLNLDYSYQLSISNQTLLRFGIKGGIRRRGNNLTDYQLYPDDKYDPEFAEDHYDYTNYNIGIGFYLSSTRYYLSLSMPEIHNDTLKSNGFRYSSRKDLFFTGGTIINLSNIVKVRPIFMVQRSLNNNITLYDISTQFILYQKVWIGGMMQSDDIVGALAQFIIHKSFRIGYSYNFNLKSDVRKFQTGIHEVILSYEIPTSKFNSNLERYF